ncbi:MAG: hypothetical protein OKBPIBMD_01140 [Chlorobi bacterium]|nr:hypothetical protein [Chlorobiota bacterium]
MGYKLNHRKRARITPQQKWETAPLTTTAQEFARVSEASMLGSKGSTEHHTVSGAKHHQSSY